MSVVIEYTVKPNPGSDLKTILEMTHESAALWRKHGGKVRLWAVTVGEVGDLVVSISFENFAAYGATFDKLNADVEIPSLACEEIEDRRSHVGARKHAE